MITKDSLFNMEKMKNIQALSFREELRQQKSGRKNKNRGRRKQNIQLVLIALGIVTIIILFLLLSRGFITNTKAIEYFGVIALLIVFESSTCYFIRFWKELHIILRFLML